MSRLHRQGFFPPRGSRRARTAWTVLVTAEVDEHEVRPYPVLGQVLKGGNPISGLIVPLEPISTLWDAQGSLSPVNGGPDQRKSTRLAGITVTLHFLKVGLRLDQQPLRPVLGL